MSLIADGLREQFAPYMTPDLGDYLDAIAAMFEETDAFVGFDLEEEGWSVLLDPANCPAAALGYLAQFMGERLPVGLNEAMQREWIQDSPNLRRGTLYSIFRAAQRTLEGSRTVSIVERSGGGVNPEDYLEVRTYTTDTPNPDWVLQDLLQVVPADIDLDYDAVDGQTWNALELGYADWDAVDTHYASWDELRTDRPGVNTFSRPRPIDG